MLKKNHLPAKEGDQCSEQYRVLQKMNKITPCNISTHAKKTKGWGREKRRELYKLMIASTPPALKQRGGIWHVYNLNWPMNGNF